MRVLPRCLPLLLLLAAACASSPDGDEEQVGSVDFYNHNAQRYYDGKRFVQARQQFEKALALDSANRTALLGRCWSTLYAGEGLIQAGKPEGAEMVQESIPFFQEIRGSGFAKDDYKILLGLGTAHVQLGDLYAARARKIQETSERRPIGLKPESLASALEERDRNYAEASRYFHEVLSQKSVRGARDNLTALLQLARVAVIYKNYSDALSYAERYLVQVRRSKELWVDAIAKYPDDRDIWEQRLAGAVMSEVEVRDLIADVNFKLGRLPEAEAELKQVILLSPERAAAYLNRGIVRQDLGKKQEAVDDFRRYLEQAARLNLPPDDPGVLEAVERLTKLEKELGLTPSFSPDEVGEKDA